MILHVMVLDKFLPPFIDFMDENFGRGDHRYVFITSEKYSYGLTPAHNVEFLHTDDDVFIALLKHMKEARKIILHGLWLHKVNILLSENIELLEKCYWVLWGGDLYTYKLGNRNSSWLEKEEFRKKVIKNMGHIVTYIPGDYELAKKWYNTQAIYHECIMYLSNVYKELDIPANTSQVTNIQVGNSADPSNNHVDALAKLLPYKDDDICIYVPLSYGNQEHAKKVIVQGEKWFGDKFIPLTDFMPLGEYLRFLGNIDIAVFNHKRQQAMGNTITLLGLGKKVYMRSDVAQWDFFQDLGVEVNDITQLVRSISKNSKQTSIGNHVNIKGYFSRENLLNQLELFIL